MDYFEALKKLANHANRPMDEDIPPEESMVFNLWLANKSKNFPDVKKMTTSVVNSLEVVNYYINGDRPSNSFNKGILERGLVFSISEIVSSIQEYALIWQGNGQFEKGRILTLINSSWVISRAWCAVLNGDIDSIEEEIKLEKKTKNMKFNLSDVLDNCTPAM